MGEPDLQSPESFEMALVLARLCFILGSIEAAGGRLAESELVADGTSKDMTPRQLEEFLETLVSQGLILRRNNSMEVTSVGRQWLHVTGRVLDANM